MFFFVFLPEFCLYYGDVILRSAVDLPLKALPANTRFTSFKWDVGYSKKKKKAKGLNFLSFCWKSRKSFALIFFLLGKHKSIQHFRAISHWNTSENAQQTNRPCKTTK